MTLPDQLQQMIRPANLVGRLRIAVSVLLRKPLRLRDQLHCQRGSFSRSGNILQRKLLSGLHVEILGRKTTVNAAAVQIVDLIVQDAHDLLVRPLCTRQARHDQRRLSFAEAGRIRRVLPLRLIDALLDAHRIAGTLSELLELVIGRLFKLFLIRHDCGIVGSDERLFTAQDKNQDVVVIRRVSLLFRNLNIHLDPVI